MKKDLTVLLVKSFHIAPRQKELYLQALTHSSYAHEHNLGGNTHNERLEFLGDAVLELAVSEILYHRFPRLPEGKLTRFRAGLVCEESLARLAGKLQLGSYLRLGRGEASSGGRRRPSLLADALEALLGAIYLDQGFAAVRNVVEELFQPLLQELEDGVLINDFKTLLQEYTQAKMGVTPEYIIVNESGPDHEKIFTAQLLLDGRSYGEGSGRSKKEAEQEAARAAYERLVNGK